MINSIAMKVVAGILILVHASRDDYLRGWHSSETEFKELPMS